jgi:23S rRNA pseudouridine2457 synthase
MSDKKTYIAFHKPFGVLSQFSKEKPDHITLVDFFNDIKKDIYPVGRLDKDSEGLLLLTNDKKLTDDLLNPKNRHSRSYWVQVDGQISEEALSKLSSGTTIKVKGIPYHTIACKAKLIPTPPIKDRIPPIRYRKNIPTSWISITLHEGKNRQIRKMCASVGFPVLRLVRYRIGRLSLNGLESGEKKRIAKHQL